MKECREFEVLIDRAHTGEASAEEWEALLEHLESCPDCNDAFEAVGKLKNADLCPEPSDEELLSMRRAVIRAVRHETDRRESHFAAASFFRQPLVVGVFALVMLAIGFLLGDRASNPGVPQGMVRDLAPADRFIGAIQTVARDHNDYEDIVNSPFAYTNVRVTEGNAGMVNLSFDVSRHLDLTLKRRDPLVTEVLVQSLIESSGVGTRLNAITIADSVPDPKIKKSLIVAMLHDENLAVRMSAQSKLIEPPGDPEIVDSLLAVLKREPSVGMRLVAIDYLTNLKIQPERLRQAITAGTREGSEAVLVKASQYLNH